MFFQWQLLVEYQTALAPDPHDPLHELLDDLGEVIDVDMLLGKSNGWLAIRMEKSAIIIK